MCFNNSDDKSKRRTVPAVAAVGIVLLLVVSLLIWKLPTLLAKKPNEPAQTSTVGELMESEQTSLSEPESESIETAQITQEGVSTQETIDNEQLEAEHAAAYQAAEALLAEGDRQGAWKAFTALGDYRDSSQRASLIYEDATSRKTMTEAEVGDCVIFGTYEQDSNRANGPEWIEWLVLAKEEDRILVITKYVLISKAYDASLTGCTWDCSPMRDFLNGSFVNTVFSEEEQARIPVVTVTADPNPTFDTDPGADTQDRVFLLNVVETDRYFSSDEARKCLGTTTSVAQGLYLNETYTLDGKNTCYWWLRQPGRNMKTTACIDADGTIHPSGYLSDEDMVGVRPALWIDIG